MGWLQLEPDISAGLEQRFRLLRHEYWLTDEDVVTLIAQARRIFEGRIRPAISPDDPSISTENWCEGVGPVLAAILHQSCLDAARVWAIRLVAGA